MSLPGFVMDHTGVGSHVYPCYKLMFFNILTIGVGVSSDKHVC